MLTAIEALAIVAPASIGGRVVVFRGARSFQARIAPRRGGVMDQTPTKVDRRAFLRAAAGATASLPVLTRRASAQPKPTISYWNGLTGADGKIMDELIDQFTKDTGIRMERQRIVWAELYAKLLVAGAAEEGRGLAVVHRVEGPQLARYGIL